VGVAIFLYVSLVVAFLTKRPRINSPAFFLVTMHTAKKKEAVYKADS
jgi:hypothetical protein